jgi:hypothetical protein
MPSDDIFARRAIVDRELKKLKTRLAELEKSSNTLNRKSRGITKANKDLVALARKVQDIETRYVAGGPTPAVMQELERLNTATSGLYLQVAEQGDTLRSHGDRITTLEQSEAHRINFSESRIEVAHEGEIESSTPWGQAFVWGLGGALVGFFLFVLIVDVKNGWIGVLASFGIAFFTAAYLLQKHYLRLAIQARHNWAYRDVQSPTAAMPVVDATTDSNWWDAQPAGSANGDAS